MVIAGPFLAFLDSSGGTWNLSAIVVTDGAAPAVTSGGADLAVDVLWPHRRGTVYRARLSFPMDATGSVQAYAVDGATYEVHVPAIGQNPTMAYVSCNGFSSLKLMKSVKDKNRLWRAMAERHGLVAEASKRAGDDVRTPRPDTSHPYHLLLMGGDQVYADEMWETVSVLRQWNEKGWSAGNATPLTPSMRRAFEDFYFDLYVRRWSQKEVAAMMARVPGIAMWDDHDLVDGWGSYEPERQECPVFHGIWQAAAQANAVFQHHLLPGRERRSGAIGNAPADWWQQDVNQDQRAGAFSIGTIVGRTAILAVDMRSQRTNRTQVVGAAHWKEVYDWTRQALDTVDHLVVMSSIPVLYPSFAALEKVLGIFPGHQDLEDDLRDHWNSVPHRDERLRLVHNLLEISEGKGVRVTLVSGDVHVGAIGTIQSTRQDSAGLDGIINQLISSGVVHPGPGATVLMALQHLFDAEDPIDTRITGRMQPFPGSQARFLGARNYLSIEPDPPEGEGRLWCNWIAEGQDFVFTKVIHPLPHLFPLQNT